MRSVRILIFGTFLTFTDIAAQEHFVKWIDEQSFVIDRNVGGAYEPIKISLPRNRESTYHKQMLHESNADPGSDLLSDGSVIHFRENNLFRIYPDGSEKPLTYDEDIEQNFELSPDQRRLAYTKRNDLFVLDLQDGTEQRLTHDGSESIYNGWASWVYYEEILGRISNHRAFWWNPDGNSLAFLQFDDSEVPQYPIYHADGQRGSLEIMHYPKAGDTNPSARLGVVDLRDDRVVWVKEDGTKDQYTAWPFWTPDGKHLLFQELNREQDVLAVVQADPKTGERTTVFSIQHKTWVDFIEEMHFVSDHVVVFRSNHEGWQNLYQFDLKTMELQALTDLSWNITEIDQLDKDQSAIYFYGSGDVAQNRHYYKLDLGEKSVTQITKEDGWHQVIAAPQHRYIFDSYSTLHHAARGQVLDVSTGKLIYALDKPDDNRMEHVKTFSVETEDGFLLPGYMVLPKNFDVNKKYPVVVTIYGGPDRQEVTHKYQDYSRSYYRNNGIIQVKVDHRGSGIYGRKGLDYLHRSLGQWEINDLTHAAKWLREQPFVDAQRLGITGGSYGGYITCMALTAGADYFTHGVSLYPVTDWSLYDNVYTERYMDHPDVNPNGYMAGAAMTHAHKYKGAMLIVHGSIDENVHMQNTLQFVSVMQDLGKTFEMMVYPGQRHGWGGPKQTHLMTMTQNFWAKHFFRDQNQNLR